MSVFGVLRPYPDAKLEWEDFLDSQSSFQQRYDLWKLRQPQSLCGCHGDAYSDSICA